MLKDKILYLKAAYGREWDEKRREVDEELSKMQGIFCLCGRLATGLHERSCRRFNSKVDSETAKKLSHLLKKD